MAKESPYVYRAYDAPGIAYDVLYASGTRYRVSITPITALSRSTRYDYAIMRDGSCRSVTGTASSIDSARDSAVSHTRKW